MTRRASGKRRARDRVGAGSGDREGLEGVSGRGVERLRIGHAELALQRLRRRLVRVQAVGMGRQAGGYVARVR